jgi:hypothetical protein
MRDSGVQPTIVCHQQSAVTHKLDVLNHPTSHWREYAPAQQTYQVSENSATNTSLIHCCIQCLLLLLLQLQGQWLLVCVLLSCSAAVEQTWCIAGPGVQERSSVLACQHHTCSCKELT